MFKNILHQWSTSFRTNNDIGPYKDLNTLPAVINQGLAELLKLLNDKKRELQNEKHKKEIDQVDKEDKKEEINHKQQEPKIKKKDSNAEMSKCEVFENTECLPTIRENIPVDVHKPDDIKATKNICYKGINIALGILPPFSPLGSVHQ